MRSSTTTVTTTTAAPTAGSTAGSSRAASRLLPGLLWPGLALVALGAGACGGGSPSMGQPLDEMAVRVDTLERTLAAHATAIAGAPDLGAVGTIETDHRAVALGQMQMMTDDTHAMMHGCHDGAGTAPDTRDIAEHVGDMENEAGAHSEMTSRAGDLGIAQGEEQRHQASMAMHIAKLRDRMRLMRESAGTFSCGMM